MVRSLESEFSEMLGGGEVVACSSGTAAIHAAVAAVDPEPGEEIISSPITDMGAIYPILYQGAVPVFADVDRKTANVTAETIAARISERTRAIIVTHLFGAPCDMDPILEVAGAHGIPVIEDCAQAYGAKYRGRPVGTMGAVGCFSMQQGKHLCVGEGGMAVGNGGEWGRRMRTFVNKAWDYQSKTPDHTFLAANYRMNELSGAVALAQLRKLPEMLAQRLTAAERLNELLRDVAGVEVPVVAEGDTHGYWRYALLLDDPDRLGRELREVGIASAPRYIQKPAFACEVFRTQKTLGKSRFPFSLARPEALDYRAELFPGTYEVLRRVLVLGWNERMETGHAEWLAERITAAMAEPVEA
jgi:dTDP-4-amino-4,6-dideoxygalactose transaminase